MNPDVVLPLLSSLLSFIFFVLLVDQWRVRRRSFQAAWALGMLWYAISAGTEFLGAAGGWSEGLYRAWYLFGAVFVAAWLGMGTALLLARTRYGYMLAALLLGGGLASFAGRAKYADAAEAGTVILAIAAILAVVVVILTFRERHLWAHAVAVVLVAGSIAAAVVVLTAPLPAPGYVLNAQGVPIGELFPGSVRVLSPVFNIAGGLTLTFGAVFSAYVFMPKRRIINYDLEREQGWLRVAFNVLLGVVAVPVNFLASIPAAVRAYRSGTLNSRVPSTLLLAAGGVIPSITSSLNRFGVTSAFFLGELLGVVFLFLGFLASIEVFREFRVPFTNKVLRARRAE